MKKLLYAFAFLLVSSAMFAQGSISGKVVDPSTGEGLIGASVLLDGASSTGTVTDYDGSFMIGNLPSGEYTMTTTYIGFTTTETQITVGNGNLDLGVISLEEDIYALTQIEVVADYVVERKTPVAVATIEKEKIEKLLGSRDIPMMMNLTPSVYATEQGGGAGDARINVRGFDQKNVAIMINGVPVNDMENGWVYWSNWDGIGDATSSVQLQRGLSAVNLATPSIGGTMNIVTSPADKNAGGSAKFEYGTGNFLKATLTGHSGLLFNNKFALSASAVRKVGEGIVDKTWTDSWAYYVGASYQVSKNHKLELFALGAPQRHGQNLYKQNIAAYGHDFARGIDGYDTNAFEDFSEANDSLASEPRLYNENWNQVSGYSGQQSWNGKTRDRYSDDFINERENYYNKPLANLNWYADWSDVVSTYATVYWSGGKGGGSGTLGSMRYNYHVGYDSPSRIVDWNATIANNMDVSNAGASQGILRNSVNEQSTIGALAKVKLNWSDNFKSTVGLDWRTASIDHFREVRDLLGGTYYLDNSDEFNPNRQAGLGDKIAYYNTNDVNWIGTYIQSEYSNEQISVFGMLGLSSIKYDYTDHFAKDENDPSKSLNIQTDAISGLQVKGGFNYRFTQNINGFVNLGYVSKVPIFDAVIDDRNGIAAANPVNEKFVAGELGANYFTNDNSLQMRLSLYNTVWRDRTKRFTVDDQSGSTDIIYVTGMDQRHFGVEFDASYKPIDLFEVGLTLSFADWINTNDVSGKYRSYEDTAEVDVTYNYYVEGLKVGDAPQNQVVASLTLFPVEGLSAQFVWSNYSKFYARWDPFSRTDETDKSQSWQMPNYSLLDMHISYDLPLKGRTGLKLFLHGFNLFDEMYISDAVDNSRYNAFMGEDDVNSHKASAAEVFLGSPRKFNLGAKVTF